MSEEGLISKYMKNATIQHQNIKKKKKKIKKWAKNLNTSPKKIYKWPTSI